MPRYLVIVGPTQNGIAGELGTVVTHDCPGRAALDEQPIELAGDPDARDRGIGNQRQALARAVIDDHQDAKPPTVDELIGCEVDRPALIRELRNGHWRTRPKGSLASASPAYHEPLLAIEPKQALMVHDEALPSQQYVQTTVAEPSAHVSQGPQ